MLRATDFYLFLLTNFSLYTRNRLAVGGTAAQITAGHLPWQRHLCVCFLLTRHIS